jgi:hypothetical protein
VRYNAGKALMLAGVCFIFAIFATRGHVFGAVIAGVVLLALSGVFALLARR